jgi:cell division protease FtsH
MEHEVVFAGDVEEIFGKRPWKSRADELLEEQKKDEEVGKVQTPPIENLPTDDEEENNLPPIPSAINDTDDTDLNVSNIPLPNEVKVELEEAEEDKEEVQEDQNEVKEDQEEVKEDKKEA